jgi:hypothetical protein
VSYDARGVWINRDDLVVWFGRIPGDKSRVHLGAVDGFSFFGRVVVSQVGHGVDGEWRTTGATGRVRPVDLIVIEDAPEAVSE